MSLDQAASSSLQHHAVHSGAQTHVLIQQERQELYQVVIEDYAQYIHMYIEIIYLWLMHRVHASSCGIGRGLHTLKNVSKIYRVCGQSLRWNVSHSTLPNVVDANKAFVNIRS